jgi:signal transduction histidine kinase
MDDLAVQKNSIIGSTASVVIRSHWISRKRTRSQRLFSVCALVALANLPALGKTPLTTIAEVRSLPKNIALQHLPVHLRPVVTYFDPVAQDLFLHDETGGIWMGWNPNLPKPAVGDLLDFSGETDYSFAPDVANGHWSVIGRTSLPEPRRVSYEQMASTSEDSRWVEIEGIIRQTEYLHHSTKEKSLWMDVAMSGDDIDVQIPWDGSPVPTGLIDARVRIRGVCGAEFNPKRQMVGVVLYVPSLREILRLEPANSESTSGPPIPIGSLQKFGYQNTEGHRVKLVGTVTAVLPTQGFYMKDDSGSILVVARQDLRLKLDDRVETLGFVGLSESHIRLEDAYFSRVGSGHVAEPTSLTAAQAMSGQYDSGLVSLSGRVVGRSFLPRQQTLVVREGASMFTAVYADHVREDQLPREGSRILLTGICINQINDLGQVASFHLLVQDASAVAILEKPTWWTLRRTIDLLGLLVAAIALVLAWVFVLKRRVRKQTLVISQKLAQEESLKNAAQLASKTKSEFLANMSHEIRTPMNAIVGFTDLLLDTRLDEEQSDYIRTIQFSSHALTRILNDVLDFSKIEAGHLVFESTPFSVSACATQVLRLITPEAIRKGLTTSLEIDQNVCEQVIGDPYRLHQVLLNLLNNAVKFTENGSITLAISCTDRGDDWSELQFSIIDTGIGIPKESQGRIFESFSQADGSMTRRYGGTGLGLAICSRLVSLFHGRIWLESEPGSGSRFHFTARLLIDKARKEEVAAVALVKRP